MGEINYIAFGIPAFFLFVLLEYLLARRKGIIVHNLENSISNISIGIAGRLLDVFVVGRYHRLAHKVNIFLAAHIVHHQAEDFNYTVSARITVFQAFIRTGRYFYTAR